MGLRSVSQASEVEQNEHLSQRSETNTGLNQVSDTVNCGIIYQYVKAPGCLPKNTTEISSIFLQN